MFISSQVLSNFFKRVIAEYKEKVLLSTISPSGIPHTRW